MLIILLVPAADRVNRAGHPAVTAQLSLIADAGYTFQRARHSDSHSAPRRIAEA